MLAAVRSDADCQSLALSCYLTPCALAVNVHVFVRWRRAHNGPAGQIGHKSGWATWVTRWVDPRLGQSNSKNRPNINNVIIIIIIFIKSCYTWVYHKVITKEPVSFMDWYSLVVLASLGVESGLESFSAWLELGSPVNESFYRVHVIVSIYRYVNNIIGLLTAADSLTKATWTKE